MYFKTLYPGLAHFVECALILSEIGLEQQVDYFGSAMLQ